MDLFPSDDGVRALSLEGYTAVEAAVDIVDSSYRIEHSRWKTPERRTVAETVDEGYRTCGRAYGREYILRDFFKTCTVGEGRLETGDSRTAGEKPLRNGL